ncbi:M48 family metalloprotease [Aerosakkonemataceae cyanobacterium BLCC-F154]|uniref:M48 family metalloprotease n=1 Tax=Floridaenema fluviatile BLCC-F154 TaxID=3153640 RepID=A0ABV4Y9C5_9CYAN
MKDQEFNNLIQKLEKYARVNPSGYNLRVGLLAALGFGYIFLVFALLCTIFWLLGLKQISFFLVLAIAQLLYTGFTPPKGVELTRQEVPELFALIDELIEKLKTPKFDRILLDTRQNAGVLQIPRLGILFIGWQKNFLILGLPLMHSLSPEQFRAILAHELGHLSGNHSRFSGWIYQLRYTWFNLVERFHANGQGGSFLFSKFFNWYEPFFRAYSFVLARNNEYEADRYAAELAGSHNAAQALINIEIKEHYLQEYFWRNFYKQALEQSETPNNTMTKMLQQLAKPIPESDAKLWLDWGLTEKTNHEDTHPCLRDRLTAFGYLPVGYDLPLPPPIQRTAAEYFFGDSLPEFAQRLDIKWQEENTNFWQLIYQQYQRRFQKFQSFKAKAKTHLLTVESTWKYAQLTSEFQGAKAAIPLYQEVLSQQPQHVAANFNLGQILLKEQDFRGIEYLETAMQKDPELVVAGCKLIYAFFQRQGNYTKAKIYQERIEANFYLVEQAIKERREISDRTRFFPHDLPEEEIKQIVEQLSTYPQIKEAYLAQKTVTHFPEKPIYVLAIIRRFLGSDPNKYQTDAEFIDLLLDDLNFSGEVLGIAINQHNNRLRDIFRKIPALIYP